MITKRLRIYETNSSSMHSIVVSGIDRGFDYNLPLDSSGTLFVEFGEYGWGPEILSTSMEKLSYFFTDLANMIGITYPSETTEEVWNDGCKRLLDRDETKNLIKILEQKVPGFKRLDFVRGSDNLYIFGYIDHQSTGTLIEEKDPVNIVFDNSKIIMIDNDNSWYYEDWAEPSEYEKGGRP